MSNELLDRLERATGTLIEQNRQLRRECLQLRQEKADWTREKTDLLQEVEQILARLETLDLEGIE